MGPRRLRAGLRARTAVALALGGLEALVDQVVTSELVGDDAERHGHGEPAEREAVLNARFTDAALAPADRPVAEVLIDVSDQRSPVLVEFGGRWYGTVVGLGRDDVPTELRESLDAGEPAVALTRVGGGPAAVTGLALPASGARFYQVESLVELDATLAAIRNSLAAGAAVTAAAAALMGLLVSRRVLRPLREMASTAERITRGDLAARLPADDDPDLSPLLESFNVMTEALDRRIELERRFAADVSHELRTPLTAINSAVHLVERRSPELSATGVQALAVLREQVDKFTKLVLELLDLSRLEADLADVVVEDVHLRALLSAVLAELEVSDDVLVVEDSVPTRIATDPRRLRVVVRNLLENADRYGGGCTRLAVLDRPGAVRLEVDDDGPGLGDDDPDHLFERFHRGSVAKASGTGTGLGLALVAENVRALGGTVGADESAGGGARFIVTLPAVSEVGAAADGPPASVDALSAREVVG
jgi:two-component system, OmpR family, sensor histidine kinase MtrB